MGAAFRPTDSLASWGRVVRATHQVARPRFPDELGALVSDLNAGQPGLAVGLRRSYGDSNLHPGGRIIDMTGLDRMIAFDRAKGVLRVEAGVSLSQCLRIIVPAGWFLPTTPGTRFVTLGGAVANDVHGKNHHSAGSFGNSVMRLKLRRTDGSAQELAPGDPLFHATVGGLGLTGVIEWVEFRLAPIRSAWLEAEDTPFGNISEYFDLSREKKDGYEHTMAWIDCLAGGSSLGCGIFSAANWSLRGQLTPHGEEPKLGLPTDAPGFLLNPVSVKAHNILRREIKKAGAGPYHPHYDPFLYPLDGIANWNRLYGSRGFYQYQCVLPPGAAQEGVAALLKLTAASGQGSFLAVLKDFGAVPPQGLLSFPCEGTTLALDFQNQGESTLKLMSDLDRIVAEAGGRLYPAKDGRIPAKMFQAGFPKWQEFRAHLDPGLASAFWKRVSQ
jgi:L-gulonolactone oxidase